MRLAPLASRRSTRFQLVSQSEAAGGDRAGDREFASHAQRRDHFSLGFGVAGAGETQDIETDALGRQSRAAADRSDHDIGPA
jgi:hypothetical protein